MTSFVRHGTCSYVFIRKNVSGNILTKLPTKKVCHMLCLEDELDDFLLSKNIRINFSACPPPLGLPWVGSEKMRVKSRPGLGGGGPTEELTRTLTHTLRVTR